MGGTLGKDASRHNSAPNRHRFWRDEKGLAAVEFAMILPVMLFLYLGMVELSRGVRAARQVDTAAQTIADLIGQNSVADCTATPASSSTTTPAMICVNYFQNVITAAVAMMAPMQTSSLTVTVSEINIQQGSSALYATVNWSLVFNGGASRAGPQASYPACNSIASSSLTPSNALTPSATITPVQSTYISNASVTTGVAAGPIIIADVTYTYTPIVQLGLGMFGGGSFGKLFTQGGFLMSRTVTGTVRNVFAGGAPLYNHMLFPQTAAVLATTTMTLNGNSYNISGYNCLSPAQ